MTREQYLEELSNKLEQTIAKYKEKFGEKSLERCIEFMFNPMDISVPNLAKEKAIEDMSKAIENNKPLRKMPEEMYKKIIF